MKKLTFILFLLVTSLMQAQTVEKTYHFSQPVITEHDGYQQVNFDECLPTGQVGEPTLPWHSVSLILPQGQEAAAIHVEFSDYIELEGTYNLYPYQKPRPYSSDEVIPFAKNESLYRSGDAYPIQRYSEVNTQYLNGVALAFSGFTPIQYVPATGKVSYARTVSVSIETTATRVDNSRKLWLTPENEASIKRLAQNEEMLNTYSKRGREVNGYDMLVITAEAWVPSFEEYLNLYNSKGIRTHIVSLEEIYASMDGCDEQEKIRNYIIQEYENNGISMVSLGGDVGIVPFRFLWCFAQEGYEDQIPADMYYACLDGSLNDDGDDRWGEVGEDDLLPELGIGRLPFNNETQFTNIMHKTFSYLHEPVLGEFTSPILGAEHLGDGYYASTDMERLIGVNHDYDYTTYGYPTDYNFKRYYETASMPWSGTAFRNVIGTGGQYVHHAGHANTGIVANWDISGIDDHFFANNNGVDHNYMLFHSHGCICGDFSHGCILEKMVTLSTGFVLATGNSRYGWYVPWGDGMAAHIHREFVDAYCHDHIASVGMALREAKIATAPWVTTPYGDEGCLRWNIYCLNVLGDAALCPWFEEPFNPDVVYETGLKTGTTSTTVNVNHYGNPLDNFRVSLYDGETLLGFGVTDPNGNALLNFSPALDVVGELNLIITGQSAWPQTLTVNGFDNNEPYIDGEITSLDSEALFGTSRWVVLDIHNRGGVTAHNIHVELTSESEYITSNPSDFTIDELGANNTNHYDQGIAIAIADDIPDQTPFTLYLTTYLNDIAHTTQKSFLASAPNLQFTTFEIEEIEGNGNDLPDPGERVTIHVNGTNFGHATAPETYLTVECNSPHILLENNTVSLNEIGVNGNFTGDITFVSDEDFPTGTVFHFIMTLHSGAYTVTVDHPGSICIVIESFENGDFSYTDWEHGGDLPWIITDEEAHSGTYSARSGAIGNDQFSRLIIRADILENSEISFFFKTSSEYRKDMLAFYIDDEKQDWWSGENDWTYASFNLTAGSHVFEWVYAKGHNGSSGADCAWIDDITFPRTCIVTEVEEVIIPSGNSIYPNPCNGNFTIEVIEESNVTIFNAFGQKISEYQKVSGIRQIPLENAPKGLYLIQIQNGDTVDTKKLIIQ